jgi:arginine exporter protein ArgO
VDDFCSVHVSCRGAWRVNAIGTVWIAEVTYPLMIVLTLIGFDNLTDHKQVDLETVAIVGAASLAMIVPVTSHFTNLQKD